MKRIILISSAVCAAGLIAFVVSSHAVSAQNEDSKKDKGDKDKSPPVYNPYPPGILPPDLNSEIMRVQREIRGLEAEAMTQAQALPPLTFTSNPPTIHGSGYKAVETLGKLFQYDLTMSPFENTACASCHMPYAAFSGPIPSVNLTMVVSRIISLPSRKTDRTTIHLFTGFSCYGVRRS